jgi:hypothetical protein
MRSKVYELFEQEAKRQLANEKKDETSENTKKRCSDLIKKGGIDNLSLTKDKQGLQDFIDLLAKYGVFVLERGELERWLPALSQELGKQEWLPNMFERMGSLNDPATYVHAGEGDVWDFMRKIAQWVDTNSVNPPREDLAGDTQMKMAEQTATVSA